LAGKTLHLTQDNYGCNGCGRAIFSHQTKSREDYLRFLVNEEGLKKSHALMNEWLDATKTYQPTNENILIGQLRKDQYDYLKTVTFFVNPDQFSVLVLGAQYYNSVNDQPAVILPFGSGCMEMISLFDDLSLPQAVAGALDISIRKYFPPNIMAFSVTKSLYEQLCQLDEHSFLCKRFLKELKKTRGGSLDKNQSRD
jgi:hypothetical protein